MDVFFENDDYKTYLNLLKQQCEKAHSQILGYCLMPNHVHLIIRPNNTQGLRHIGEIHRLYTRYINRKMDWQGYLWQGRFGSYPMDDAYFYNALRYVQLNPVMAEICDRPDDYRWSCARQRIGKNAQHDLKVTETNMIQNWPAYWSEGLEKHKLLEQVKQNIEDLKPQISRETLVSNTDGTQ